MKLNQPKFWYHHRLHPLALLLWPFSQLFSLSVAIRRYLYRIKLFRKYYFPIPVIVVGNLTVGGTGKTPFVIWLAQFLKSQGYQPGIVSRGVGGKRHLFPHQVQITDSPQVVGDEALLLLKQTNCPLVIAVNRAKAAHFLLQHTTCNVIISDDGLQHYRLDRQIEIVMVDGERKWGNGYLLPAGPLRESLSRLADVDIIMTNGNEKIQNQNKHYLMSLEPGEIFSVKEPQQTIRLSEFSLKKVHAVAGIGNPERFFNTLRQARIEVISHVFPDHYLYQSEDLNFKPSHPILMTEKDAVKCKAFAKDHYWYLSVKTNVDSSVGDAVLSKLKMSST